METFFVHPVLGSGLQSEFEYNYATFKNGLFFPCKLQFHVLHSLVFLCMLVYSEGKTNSQVAESPCVLTVIM